MLLLHVYYTNEGAAGRPCLQLQQLQPGLAEEGHCCSAGGVRRKGEKKPWVIIFS